MRANSLSGERIKFFAAFATTPDFPARRRNFAVRAGESFAARKFGNAGQRAGVSQATPAINQYEYRHDALPLGL